MFNKSEVKQEEIQLDSLQLITHSGEIISIEKYFDELKKELHKHPINKVVEKKVFLPMSKLTNSKSNKTLFIDGFILWGKLTELPRPKFFPVDEIWLLMKSIFEEKSYTISKKGIIKEDNK